MLALEQSPQVSSFSICLGGPQACSVARVVPIERGQGLGIEQVHWGVEVDRRVLQ